MSKINHTLHEIYRLDEHASREQWLNNLHPLVKLLVTMMYIFLLVSFSKYDLLGILPMAIYLIINFNLAELSFRKCLWRLKFVLPIVCAVGIANPFMDRVPLELGFITINMGVVSMLTLMIKGSFAVLASYLLIATTTIDKICYALRLLHIPAIIVTQLLLTYRYLTLLLEEVDHISTAYALRAPRQKGIHFKAWGTLTGQLLLRSIDRANNVYEAMILRGYKGNFAYIGKPLQGTDILYFIFWLLLLLTIRKIAVIYLLGNWIGGFLV